MKIFCINHSEPLTRAFNYQKSISKKKKKPLKNLDALVDSS